MATMYRMTDAGAPGWQAYAQYETAKRTMQIIKACLVDGYGSKGPAGWSLVYEDTTAGKHRMAISNGNGAVEFVTWGAGSIAIFVWEELTTPGTGRLGTDPWATVISAGANGLSSNNNPLPGTSSNQVAGLRPDYWGTPYSNNSEWTIVADEKSFWFTVHHPEGSASAPPGNSFPFTNNYHAQLFCGAVKSADFAPDDVGNFFVLHGTTYAGTAANNDYSANGFATNVMGLRTPTNLAPGSNMALRSYAMPAQFAANPYSSARAILPYMLTYDGPDKPVPSGINANSDEYAFATIPGIGKFSEPGSSGHNFWAYYTALHADTWFHELQEFGGAQWMPYGLAINGNDGLTTDDAWWT